MKHLRALFLSLLLLPVADPAASTAAAIPCGPAFATLSSPSSVTALESAGKWQEAAWLALQNGDAATHLRLEEKLSRVLVSGKVTAAPKLIGAGSSETYLVEVDGIKAVFKPAPRFWKQKRIRPFHEERMPQKEIAAAAFDRAINANLVPITVPRTIDGMEGSLQAYVAVDPAGTADSPHTFRSLARLRILDYLMGTYDRTPANVLRVSGAPVAIDNAMSFLANPIHLSFGIKPPPVVAEMQKEESKKLIATFSLGDPAGIERALAPHLTPEELSHAMDRVRELKRLAKDLLPAQEGSLRDPLPERRAG